MSCLLWRDVYLDDRMLVVQRGKGGRRRELPIHPALLEELRQVSVRRPSWPVARSIEHQPLTPKSMAHIEDGYWRDQIKWRVKEVAKAKGVPSALQLSVRAGVHKNTSNAIWNGSSIRVDRDTLAKLCHTLQCTPGDLLVFVGTPREEERS